MSQAQAEQLRAGRLRGSAVCGRVDGPPPDMRRNIAPRPASGVQPRPRRPPRVESGSRPSVPGPVRVSLKDRHQRASRVPRDVVDVHELTTSKAREEIGQREAVRGRQDE